MRVEKITSVGSISSRSTFSSVRVSACVREGEIEVFKEYRNEKELGLGVSNPRTDEIESPAEIVKRVKEVLRYFDPDKIYLNPDCGFGTFAERCVNTSPVAYHKLQAISEAAEMLRRECG